MARVAKYGFDENDPLPYDVLIDESGVWYGPSGTEPKSRDWYRFPGSVSDFFSIVCRPSFVLCVPVWRVRYGV